MLLAVDPVITEFMASNSETLYDGDGDSSDWIEIYNPSDEAINLQGWHLTDDRANLTRWTFPDADVGPDEFLVVFASGKDTIDGDGNLHTNFALSQAGEYLGLVHPDGVTIAGEFSPEFPAQFTDVSYGLLPNELDGVAGYFSTPTPGVANPSSFSLGPRIGDVTHSPLRSAGD